VARHNAKGIFTVRQLSYTFRPRRPAKRQEQRFPHSFALQALAIRENKVHVHGDPKFTLPTTACQNPVAINRGCGRRCDVGP